MKRSIAIVLLITFQFCAVAQKALDSQKINGVNKYFGVDKSALAPLQWNANWIWLKGQPFGDNVLLCARKTFDLAGKPDSATLYITADSEYTLWINGEYVGRGPARCAPHHQSYDVLDISSKLKKGKNVIAVKVHHTEYTVSYADKSKPGLLFQLEIPRENTVRYINSDAKVKVRNEAGWNTETPQVNGSNTAVVENFDFRKSVSNWESSDFDDSEWEAAALVKQEWWPPRKDNLKDNALMAPWHTLVPRDMPYLEETMRPVTKVFEVGECDEFSLANKDGVLAQLPVLGVVQRQVLPLHYCKIENLDAFLKQQENLVIKNFKPANLYNNQPFRSAWVVFDMGEILLGYPSLQIDAAKGTTVNVSYATVLLDEKFNPALIPPNFGDELTLAGNGKTKWEAQSLRTFRYVGLLISGTDKPVTISYAGVRQTYYPFKDYNTINPGDTTLRKLAIATDKTIKIITHDAYTDNYRERRQYIQTGFYAALGGYSLYGDPYLMRRCLMQIAQDQFADGFFPMHAPGRPKSGILEADLMWHMSLYDYYMFSGDEVTTKGLLKNLKGNLTALEEIENRNGLFENPPKPYWIDHADIDRRGINFTLNGWYVIALEKDAKLFALFGDVQEAANCLKKAQRIRTYLKERFWNAAKGLFAETEIDGTQSGLYDEITNGVALMLGIADAGQTKSIVTKIMHDDVELVMERPVIMMYWPIEGLFKAGYGKDALDLLKSRYRVMLNHPSGTLWEGWNLYTYNQNGNIIPKNRSSAQAEQVFHSDIFNRYLLGVTTVKPGMKEVRIAFHDTGLDRMSGSVPTPGGAIEIAWKLTGQKQVTVKAPKTVKIVWDKQSLPKGIKVIESSY